MVDPVKAYWEKQAQHHATSDLATAPDHAYRELEIRKIKENIANINDRGSILDVGCGNGFSTIELAKEFPTSMFIGIDYSESMIKAAQKAAKKAKVTNISFSVGDVLSISRHPELQHQKFDIVMTERCLINLANWEEQKLGILQMRKLLTPYGHLILVENTKDGLVKLNSLRKIVELEPIKEPWHNFYLPDQQLNDFFAQTGSKLLAPRYIENIGSNYYIISRVVYAKLAQMEGKEPSYDHPINKIAAMLPTFGNEYACSPNFLMVFQNIPEESEWTPKKMSS